MSTSPVGGVVDSTRAGIRSLPLTLLTLGALAAWGLASLAEGTASIFVAVSVALLIGAAVARLTAHRAPAASAIFVLAYALRAVAALTAFYSGKGQDYWVGGVGSDALAYYTTSFLDASDALFQFTYSGFVAYNNFVTHAALAFDGAHYLCNLQGPIVAGALLPVMAYAALRELRDERTARLVAVILACHPSLIAISAVLLRDTLVGAFGWASVYLVVRMVQARTLAGGAFALLLALPTLYALSLLRLQSLLVFLALSAAVIVTSGGAQDGPALLSPRVRRAAVLIIALVGMVGAASFLSGRLPPGLTASYFKDVVEYRLQSANQGSLGVALTSGSIGVSTAVYSALALLAPFPFYAWSPQVLGHPTGPLDYLVGFGGLVNQLLIAFAILGVARAIRRRDALSLVGAVFVIGFIVLTTLGGGDTIRYVAVHVFPLYAMLAVDGAGTLRERRRFMLLWVGAIIALYGAYESLKIGLGSSYLLLAAFALVAYAVAYVLLAWRVSRGRPVASVDAYAQPPVEAADLVRP